MSAVKLSTIRNRLKTALEAIAGADLKQSPLPYGAFARTPNSIAHKAFAIGFTSSTAQDDRQRATVGSLTQTSLVITMAYRLRPLAQIADVDNTLDLENNIIIAVCNRADTSLYANTHFKFTNLNRVLSENGEYLLSDISFEILHYLPLQ